MSATVVAEQSVYVSLPQGNMQGDLSPLNDHHAAQLVTMPFLIGDQALKLPPGFS